MSEPKWYDHLRDAERDDRGLTEQQQETADDISSALELEWLPVTEAVAKRTGITALEAIMYRILLLEQMRVNRLEASIQMERDRLESLGRAMEMMEESLELQRRASGPDEDWKGGGHE